MNKHIRKILDDKKLENKLKEEKKNNKEISKKQRIEKKNLPKIQEVKKEVKKEVISKKIIKEVKKEVKKDIIKEVSEKKIQSDYDTLKKKSDITEKFIFLANNIKIDDKDVPKTEKGMNTKAKELMKNLYKKLEKEEKKKK